MKTLQEFYKPTVSHYFFVISSRDYLFFILPQLVTVQRQLHKQYRLMPVQ
jgi:hypothetical protein